MTGLQGETGEALESEAMAAYFAGDYDVAIAHYERAFAAFRRESDSLGAGRSARTVWWLRANIHGDWAVANGWLRRAMAVFTDAADGTEEYGWALVTRARTGNILDSQKQQLVDAGQIARRNNNTDLEVEALSTLGVMLVLSGFTEEGMVHIDEALAIVCSGAVTELAVVEGIFCGLFATCERTYDIGRAEQWLRAADGLVRRRRYPAIAAFCRVHYGGLLTAAGRWNEAENELTTAVSIFETGYVAARSAAVARLAELRVRQGRYDEAAHLLDGIEHHFDAARPLAAVHLARGEVVLAQDVLERALQAELEDAFEGPLRALLVDVHLATGDVKAATTAAERLNALATNQAGIYLKALAALANGKVCVASGEGDARVCLNEALTMFAQAQLPVDLAQARLELAKAVAQDRPEVAVAAATAALESFERLQATRDMAAASAVLKSLGAGGPAPAQARDALTRRESEVLDLIGIGLTNAEIGDRLFISPKTVEHHVGRVLAKLGLRSRTEAALLTRTPESQG